MKRVRIIIFFIFLVLINITCVSSKNILYRCNYSQYDRQDTSKTYVAFASPILQDAQNVEENKNDSKYEYYVLNKTNNNNNQLVDSISSETTCEVLFEGELGDFLGDAFGIIRYVVPILILGLGIIDFIKGIAAQNQDEIKKAANRFVKRLAIGIVIFLLPTLIDFILGLAGFGLNDGKCFDWLR